MGSVMSDVKCPKCKFPYAFEDYYYKSGEVFLFCDRCGYSYNGYWKRNKDEYAKDKDGNRIPITERKGGFGAYHQFNARGGGVGGHFTTKWGAKKTIKQMRRWLKTHRKSKVRITVTKKINGHWFMIDLNENQIYAIPDDIAYETWMDYKGGHFG